MKIYAGEGLPDPVRVRIAITQKRVLDKVEFV